MNSIHPTRLFNASCIALITTAMTFAIRAGMIEDLCREFSISHEKAGIINSMAFFGFPAATLLGGMILDSIGMKKMLLIAFICHLLGIVLTVAAGGFTGLLISTFLIGFANGSVEAACNPMIASMYPHRKTEMLNKFHVWFPGGIVIGAVLGYFMGEILHLNWRYQCAIMLIPTFIYGFMFLKEQFPKTERVESGVSTSDMFKAVFLNPLFYFLAFCMILTANTELSTNQWIVSLLKSSGTKIVLVLAFINGVMALGRFYAGPVIHKLNPTGILLGSAVVATLGLFLLSHAQGAGTWGAAFVFAVGVCYFWPTMLGFVSENIPKSGALGLSLLGAVGMCATGLFQSTIGKWFDQNKAMAANDPKFSDTVRQLTDVATAQNTQAPVDAAAIQEQATNLLAGQHTLSNVMILPIILIAAFGILWFIMRKK